MLREYGDLTRAALIKYLPSREPRRYLYDLLSDYPQRGGKMMRSSMCIAAARLFGAPLENAMQTAVAIEMLHNALLIHDDIEDGSEKRRGRPTLHLLHGVPLALNAGDTLTLMSFKPLLDNRARIGERLTIRIIEETQRMARECAEGQAMELGWRRYNTTEIDDADYMEMVLKKTCWLATIYPVRVGALIGSRDSVDLDPFVRYGFFLGAAFQIQDDLLNLVGDDGYGKEIDGDIWEGKRTLMLIRTIQESTRKERARLSEILCRPREERAPSEVRWIRKLMDKYGCTEYARQIAHGLAGAALHEYSLVSAGLPDSRDKRFLEQMATWVIERN
ncbi:MAG: polyprenyl synthetase family protein [Candidatus Binatus sp.]|uniref:polyprenyl synthetase family protein n=1 Tax=Candidatus Binatus sp. TaxID=2811406 RepID=UPI003BB1FD10